MKNYLAFLDTMLFILIFLVSKEKKENIIHVNFIFTAVLVTSCDVMNHKATMTTSGCCVTVCEQYRITIKC